jgi:2-aminoadipate transaminase
MTTNKEDCFSNMVKRSKRSAIREILKLTQQPDMISFAGGLPASESFPIKDIRIITDQVLKNDGAAALQYGTTEGCQELRQTLVERYRSIGIDCDLENVTIVTGSQQGLDLLGKVFIDPGDKILCGLPSYLGGLSAFASYGAELIGVPLDEMGMSSSKLQEILEEMEQNGEKAKFIYLIPDFQNPAGITMTESRRLEIIHIAQVYDVLIVEDSPYREIRFEGESQALMYSLDDTDNVITLGTLSKIVAPGFRVGWILAPKHINDKFVVAKQTADICTPTFVQKIANAYLNADSFHTNLSKTVELYRHRRNLMLEGFKKYMPKEVTWTNPEGGLFIFLTLPDYLDAEVLFSKAIKKNVAFVIGKVFYCDGGGSNTLRLNFSFVNDEQNKEGIKILGGVIHEEICLNRTKQVQM